MADLLIQRHLVEKVLGRSRLLRLERAKWLVPAGLKPRMVFRTQDLHRALSRLERERCPVDKIRVAEVRASEKRTGRAYVPHPRKPRPDPLDFTIDLDGFQAEHAQSGPETKNEGLSFWKNGAVARSRNLNTGLKEPMC